MIAQTGPVSRMLEQELLAELRRQGIVVWLDKDSSYTRFVDDLQSRQTDDDFPFPIVGFRGSFLELIFALEPHGNGLDRQRLLVHVPGFNEESIRKTPLLELYDAGVRYRKSLDTLIREAATGRVAPAEVESFLGRQPTLEEADAWLISASSGATFGLIPALEEFGPHLLAEALGQPGGGPLAARVTAPFEVEALGKYLHRLTGMDASWVDLLSRSPQARNLDEVLHALAAWVLCVEYVHDLRRPAHRPELQRLGTLPASLVKACRDLASQVRRDSGDAYVRIADEVAGIFADEFAAMKPEDLGQIDTFREEEASVLRGAVEALRTGHWAEAKAWSEARPEERSFWLQRDQLRRWAWSLVAEGALFAETLQRHPTPLAGSRDLEDAVARYAAGAFEVDRAHRRFEQLRLARLESRLPHYSELRDVATSLRSSHRDWADALGRDFANLCVEHGFLPPAALQQRTLYEQVVHPLTLTSDKVAVFMIDAFRFEMATELVSELAGSGTVVDLKPRLAELPTITSVGMNVLSPVAQNGRLELAGIFQGFRTGEYTVKTPESRARSMGMRSAGKPALLLKLSHVCEASTTALVKEIKPHSLIVVHSKEIDDAGEANVGLPTFESTLRQIKAALHHLQLAGVKTFVLTADHGYLLQDETTKVVGYGTKRDPQRRHVLDDSPRRESGMVNVSLSSLGYDGLPGYLLLREDTAMFATGTPGATFAHGGNSPQERIIPVLTITRKHRELRGNSEYAVEVEPQPDVLGSHRLRLRVRYAKHTTTSLGFESSQTVDVALRVPGRDEIRVLLKDKAGPAALRSGRLLVPVGDTWTEVFFALEGPADERVRVEAYHADNVENVLSATPEQWYSVSGVAAVGKPSPAAAPAAAPAWAGSIADEAVRKVFVHIEKHGAITEAEVTHLLGSPRVFRRFSLEFEAYAVQLPFRVRIEAGESGKRYVREEDR